MKPDKIEYYNNDGLIVACIDRGANGMFIGRPDDRKPDWEFVRPGTISWDGLHQEIYLACRFRSCSRDEIEELPALPKIPDNVKFVNWYESFLPKKAILSREYPYISKFLKVKQNCTAQVYFILSEDTYETVFGDGKFLYYKKNKIYLSDQDANKYAAENNDSIPPRTHGRVYSVRSIALTLKDGLIVSDDFRPDNFEHYYLEDIVKDLESYLSEKASVITRFGPNTTLIWPCRKGDNIMWFGFKGVLANPRSCISVNDVWELKDGDIVTITNRVEDLPEWFELHPTEVCNALASQMSKKLKDGYIPKGKVDGPNIWRIKAGDRLAWVGKSRTGFKEIDGILSILDFHESALCIGDTSKKISAEIEMAFGLPDGESHSKEQIVRCQKAFQQVEMLGTPRTWTTDWRLG